jgi:hypothetical protein
MADTSEPWGPETVLTGQDGHLFEAFDYAVEQLTGELTLSPAQVARWVSLIETRHAWCRQRGMRYYFIITPEKHVIYADKLPPGIAISVERPIMRIIGGLSPELRDTVIYPDEILRNERGREETYYLTDTHWTNFGAYLAYLRVLFAIQRDEGAAQMPVTALQRAPYRKVGDLGIRLTPERSETAVRVSYGGDSAIRRVFSNRTYNVGQVDVFETPDATGSRAVMFRDSSGSFMLPFLAAHFTRLVAVASDGVSYELLRSEKPDVVISQLTERALCVPVADVPGGFRFPNDIPPIDFVTFTGVPLPLPASRVEFVDIDFTERPEPVWSVGPRTEMVLSCRVPYAACDLVLTASAFVCPPRVPSQRLDIAVNCTSVGSFTFTEGRQTIKCRVPLKCLYSARTLRLEFFHPDCVSPHALGFGADQRAISLLFERLMLRPVDS